jgi:hypothetical protein
MAEIETHIRTLEAIDADSPTVPSQILVVVAALNTDVTDEAFFGSLEGSVLRIPEKLQEWLDKLFAKVRDIVRKMSDTASFSITVGSPFTVSVSITFAKT